MFVIVIGKSGSGKDTFVEAMNCSDNWYKESKRLKEEVARRDMPVNHDSCSVVADELYGSNPNWQEPFILEALKRKKFLIFSGPRRIAQVKRLIEICSDSLVIEIRTDDRVRYNRLRERDGITPDEFKRIEKDEAERTELDEMIKHYADIVVENNGSAEKMQRTARKLARLLKAL